MLLEAGASPEFVDKVSMESAFDVAQNEDVRGILVSERYDFCDALFFVVPRFLVHLRTYSGEYRGHIQSVFSLLTILLLVAICC